MGLAVKAGRSEQRRTVSITGSVSPRVLVALGRVAAQTLLSSTDSIGRLRGQWHQLEGVPLRVTYHPAALLRNPGLKPKAWEDFQLLRKLAAESE